MRITLLLIRKAQDDVLGYIAAGRLEDFVDGYGDRGFDLGRASLRRGYAPAICIEWYLAAARQPVLATVARANDKVQIPNGRRKPLSYHPIAGEKSPPSLSRCGDSERY